MTDDPYLWLEEVDGATAMAWVDEHNSATLTLLSALPEFEERRVRNLEILTHPGRLSWPHLIGDRVYSFWQDESHERGILRSMPLERWLAGDREWETLLDIDALAAAEGVNWVFAGGDWLQPTHDRALVKLSRGGADATVVREFDIPSRSFVEGGFETSESKTHVSWGDRDTLYIASDFGPESMTRSGYARTVRRWRRGTPLAEAPTIFEADESDTRVAPATIRSRDRTRTVLYRGIDMFNVEHLLVDGDRLVSLELPRDAYVYFLHDRIVMQLRGDWSDGASSWSAGSVVELGIEEYLAGRRDFRLMLAPEPRVAVSTIAATADAIIVRLLRNVTAELRRFRFVDGAWSSEPIGLPALGSSGALIATPDWEGLIFDFTGFLQPTTMYVLEPGAHEPRAVHSQPTFFDTTGLVVEQLEATSADGTAIPYFLVRREDIPFDGTTPTILYGYGGFDVPMTPSYSGVLGSGWLERGGAYALANIRGGGEFGTAWHDAALREKRQRSYDDFIAVAESLIERRVTSPRHLGVMGGSNGGLLVGVVAMQRPELFRAVVSMVPLLDMRRYHLLHAGASWMGEYGDPDVPEDWEFLGAYSPYHNVSATRSYPHMLFTTSTRDDRVHPGHARKMAALMESMGHDVLFYENTEGGHAGAAGHRQMAMQMAIVHTYFSMQLK